MDERSWSPDLSGGPTEDAPVEQLLDATEWEVEGVEGDVYYKLLGVTDEWRLADENTAFTVREGLNTTFGRVLLHSDGDTAATIELVARTGFCKRVRSQPKVEISGGVNVGVAGEQVRLSGGLAAGTTIAHAAEASETLAVQDKEELRVRAQVSGISSFDSVDAAAQNGARALDGYENSAGEPRLATVDGVGQTLRIYDASERELTLLGSFTGTAGDNWIDVAVDPTGQVAVILVSDGTATETLVATVDITDETAPGAGGSVVIDAADTVSPSQEFIVADPVHSRAVCTHNGDLFLVDISTVGSPSQLDTLSQTVPDPIRLDADRQAVLVGENVGGNLDVQVFSYRDDALVLRSTTTVSGVGAGNQVCAYDPDAQLFAGLNGSGDLALLDATNLDDLVELATTTHTGTGGSGPYAAFDRDRELLFIYDSFQGTEGRVSIFDVSDPANPNELLATQSVEAGGTDDIFPDSISYVPGANVYWIERNDSQLGTMEVQLGVDRVRLFPLLTDGSRAGAPVQEATLEDGRPALVSATVVGEAEYEVVLEARSGQTATVDYVEQSSR